MRYLAFAMVGLFWLVSSIPEANAVVACRAGYYWHGGRCIVVAPAVRPVAQCYWRAGVGCVARSSGSAKSPASVRIGRELFSQPMRHSDARRRTALMGRLPEGRWARSRWASSCSQLRSWPPHRASACFT